MALKDIIGQERALSVLKGFIARERVPHALLFAGDDGIGKKLAAVNFAKALNCQHMEEHDLFAGSSEGQNSDRIDACELCPSCNKIDKGSHPDVFMIGPEGEGGQITVSAIRQLEEALSYKPFEGKWKVAVIDNADRLNQSAANAFLRTLEEPSAQSMLILVSSRPEVILQTIRSRCQRVNFSPLPTDIMCGLLEEKLDGLDSEKSMLLSLIAGGRLGFALDEGLLDQRNRSMDVLEQMLSGSDEDTWQDRVEMEKWFDWAQLWMRDIAVLQATGRQDLMINQDMTEEIKSIAERSALRDVLKLARELYNIRGRLVLNLNKQLTFNYSTLLVRRRLGMTDVR